MTAIYEVIYRPKVGRRVCLEFHARTECMGMGYCSQCGIKGPLWIIPPPPGITVAMCDHCWVCAICHLDITGELA